MDNFKSKTVKEALRIGLSDPEKQLAWNRALETFRCQPSAYISDALPSIEGAASIVPLVVNNDQYQHRLHKSVGTNVRHRVKVRKARLLIDMNQ